jgi:hypothetical protein
MKGVNIIKICHNGYGFNSNENALLLVTGAFHHYILLRGWFTRTTNILGRGVSFGRQILHSKR